MIRKWLKSINRVIAKPQQGCAISYFKIATFAMTAKMKTSLTYCFTTPKFLSF